MYEDDDDDLAPVVTALNGTAGSGLGQLTAALTGGPGPGNPALLEDVRRAREARQQESRNYSAMLQRGIDAFMQRRMGPTDAEAHFRMAAALGAPTRTGSFGESIARMNEVQADVLGKQREAQTAQADQLFELRQLQAKFGLEGARADERTATDLYLRDRPREPDELVLIRALSSMPPGPERDAVQRVLDARIARHRRSGQPQQRTPSGYMRDESGALTYEPGGPADPEVLRRNADARRAPGSGGSGSGATGQDPVQSSRTDPTTGVTTIVRRSGTREVLPADPNFRAPRAEPSPGDKKAIAAAEDAVPAINDTRNVLMRARDLLKNAYSGPGANLYGKVGSAVAQVPGGRAFVNRDRAVATKMLNDLLTEQAINTMSKVLAGATTDQEMNRFVGILADPNAPPEQKLEIINRALELADKQMTITQRRISELRRGTYYQPADASAEPDPPASPPPPAGRGQRRLRWVDGKLVPVE